VVLLQLDKERCFKKFVVCPAFLCLLYPYSDLL
jgi:hypothetical protein